MFKLLFLILLFNISQSHANNIDTPPINQKVSKDVIHKISDYWNSIRVIVADIIQTNPDGQRITGKIYLKKGTGNKAKLRLDYQKDYNQQLLIKRSEVLLVDLSDGSVSAYPTSMTPAALILKPHLDFEKDVKIIDSRQIQNDVQIVLANHGDENGCTLTLNFVIDNGCKLLRWKVLDAQGNITEVELKTDSLRLNEDKLVPDSFF